MQRRARTVSSGSDVSRALVEIVGRIVVIHFSISASVAGESAHEERPDSHFLITKTGTSKRTASRQQRAFWGEIVGDVVSNFGGARKTKWGTSSGRHRLYDLIYKKTGQKCLDKSTYGKVTLDG